MSEKLQLRPSPVSYNLMLEMTTNDNGRAMALALAIISEQLDYLIRLFGSEKEES